MRPAGCCKRTYLDVFYAVNRYGYIRGLGHGKAVFGEGAPRPFPLLMVGEITRAVSARPKIVSERLTDPRLGNDQQVANRRSAFNARSRHPGQKWFLRAGSLRFVSASFLWSFARKLRPPKPGLNKSIA
jgi:hypothetical protein